jgi:L-asparaginase
MDRATLNAAILVAASEASKGLGALIVFEDEIHAARDSTKVHTSRVGTFASAEHGKLGEVDGAEIVISRRTIRRGTVRTSAVESHVDLIKLCMGANARFIDFASETGSKGIVVEAFGRGNATLAVTEAVRRAVDRGVVVAIASRSSRPSHADIHGGGGGSHDLMKADAIFAGDLSGVKTRILLALLLGAGCSQAQIKETIVRYSD